MILIFRLLDDYLAFHIYALTILALQNGHEATGLELCFHVLVEFFLFST